MYVGDRGANLTYPWAQVLLLFALVQIPVQSVPGFLKPEKASSGGREGPVGWTSKERSRRERKAWRSTTSISHHCERDHSDHE